MTAPTGGSLAGRAAIVTGGAHGTGRAIADALALHGAKIIVADSGASKSGRRANASAAREAADAIGPDAVAFTESVTSPDIARELVDLALGTFGRLDIVVNDAAIQRSAPVLDADPADWDAVLLNNLSAPFYLTNAATAAMRRHGTAGRIVNVVATTGLHPRAGRAAHASAAAGLIGLTRTTALDLAAQRITANAVVPRGDGVLADVVAALCTDEAEKITGHVLGVRGSEVYLFDEPHPAGNIDAGQSTTLAADLTRLICSARSES